MKKIKVMYIHFNSELSGSDISMYNMVKSLDNTMFRPIVILPKHGPLVQSYSNAGISILFTPMKKLRKNMFEIINYFVSFPREMLKLMRIIAKEKPDIIHINDIPNIHALLASKIMRVKTIQHIRKYEITPHFIYDFLCNLIAFTADMIIVVSRANIEVIPNNVKKRKEIRCIYNGVDIEYFDIHKYSNVRSLYNIEDDKVVIGNISNFGYMKGQNDILEIAENLFLENDNVIFIFMGNTNGKGFSEFLDSYKKVEKRWKDRILIFNNSHPVPEILSLIDIFVFPSKRESFPRAIIEAMAMGKAIVAYRVGGIGEALINEYNGILVDVGDTQSLKRAIELLVRNKNLRDKLGQRACEKCRSSFDMKLIISDVERAYLDLIKD